jgi:hypothetical protein
VSARHQVKRQDRISEERFSKRGSLFQTGPAEETGFLRSVRVSLTARNFTGAKARLEIWS